MSTWDDLADQFKQSAPPQSTSGNNDQGDVWHTLAATHKMPTQTVTSQHPDNSDYGQRMQNMVADMPWYQKGAAAVGAGLSDIGMAAKQLLGKATPQEVDEKRKMDSYLTNDPLSGAAKFAGAYGPAMALPTGGIARVAAKVLPKMAPVAEGAVQGGVGGFSQPIGTGESRTFNTLSGTVLGGSIPGAVALSRGAIGAASPEAAALAQKAIKDYNIPLQASDITDSKFLKSLNSMFGDMPVTGGIANAQKEAKQVAFNRAVGKTFGAEADRLTPDAVQSAHQNMVNHFNDIYSRNPADAFKVNAAIQPVLSRLEKEGTDEQKRFIYNRLNELNSNIDDATGGIDGQFFNGWQSSLGKSAGDDHLKNEFRKAAIRGYNSELAGMDADLLNQTKSQYRNFKTVNPLLDKAPTGDISPGLLQGRVASQFSDYSRGGGGDLGDLARIGSRFMVDRTPKTGGSGRALLQNSMLANALTLPTVTPLAVGMNSNLMRDAIIKKALGTGFLNSSPVIGLLGNASQRVATQALPSMTTNGLLSF